MASPRATVVVSTFNYGRFLGATLESILGQGLSAADLEVLVYDDASTDDTPEVVRRFGDRVTYRRLGGVGLVPTLNEAFAAARGSVVCPIDADDLWVPERMARVLALFDREPDLGAVTHGSREIAADGRDLGRLRLPPAVGRWTLADLLAAPLKPGHLSCVSFRRGVLSRLLPMPGGRRFALPDAYLFEQSVFHAPAGVIPEPLALYRQHGGNWSDRLGRMKADPVQLAVGYGSQRLLDVELRRSLRARGLALSWDAGEREGRLRRRLEALSLLNAHRGRRARAWRLARALAARLGGRAGAFKAAALGLAAACPGCYRLIHLAYRGARMRLRAWAGLEP